MAAQCQEKDVTRFGWKMAAELVTEEWCQAWVKSVPEHAIVADGTLPAPTAAAAEPSRKGQKGKRKVRSDDQTSPWLPNQKVLPIKGDGAGGAASAETAKPRKKKKKREVPMEGSPILEVHTSYAQTGAFVATNPPAPRMPPLRSWPTAVLLVRPC